MIVEYLCVCVIDWPRALIFARFHDCYDWPASRICGRVDLAKIHKTYIELSCLQNVVLLCVASLLPELLGAVISDEVCQSFKHAFPGAIAVLL